MLPRDTEKLKSGAGLAEFGHHARKNGHQFIRFPQKMANLVPGNAAIVAQQLQPELRLVRLLEQAFEL